MRLYKLLFALSAVVSLARAAQDPVQWTLTLDRPSAAPGAKLQARLSAAIEPGWHLYSLLTPKGGPIPSTVSLAASAAVASVRVFQPAPQRKFDPNFNLETETYEKEVTFLLEIELAKAAAPGPVELTAQVRYQCCNDTVCLPPKRKTAVATLTIDPAAPPTPAAAIPAGYKEFHKSAPTPPKAPAPAEQGLAQFLLIAFGAGIASLFTPCVFPMIPFTVSFFMNRKSGLLQATVFCVGIVVFFTGLGVLIKTVAGPFGVVQLGNSPWVNSFIALVFIVFGVSLLGAFELTLPSALVNRLDQASQRGGYAGTLLMGFTFTLTSFACIGPIVGPLLVASVQSQGLQPVFGMMAFSSGLAAPFFLLALFPSFLQRLPRSGEWMVRVKVVFGFIVLAASLKYISTVDQVLQKGLISREVFLAGWVVLFALPGLYLLGMLRLEGVKREDNVGTGRLLMGAAFLIFSLSLLPGLFGAPLGEIDGLIPAAAKPSEGTGAAGPIWMKDQYKEALNRARQESKLVFVNFTGYACTNCHWMKANMFTRPEIKAELGNFVLLDLYTDGTDAASVQNQTLEDKKFSTVAIPFYAILDPDEKIVATFPGLTRNATDFLTFLRTRN